MYICDSHTHTHYSFDAKQDASTSLSAICDAALQHGLSEIAFTDHLDLNSDWAADYSAYDADTAFQEIQTILPIYAGRLRITYGIELGQATQQPEKAKELLKKYPFEFVIGSLHNLNHLPDFYYMKYEKMNPLECKFLWKRYLEEVYALVEWGNFDTLAHLTYPLRYILPTGHNLSIADYPEQIAAILHLLIEKGIALEVNTSGLRQKIKRTMPDDDLLLLYRQFGGELLTCGSDSHNAAAVGSQIAQTYEHLKSLGFRFITVYHQRKPESVLL